LAFEYVVLLVVPLLMVCFDRLNHVVSTFAIATIDVVGLKLEENMSGVGGFN
jgi:hypothetical protein